VHVVQDGFPWSAFWAGVQAIGALAALGLAIALPRIQEYRDRQRLRETVLGYAQLIRDSVKALAIYAGDFFEVANKIPLQQASVELKLPMIIAAAERLPLERLHSREAASTFIKLIGAAQTYQAEMSKGHDEQYQQEPINGFTVRRFAADRVIGLHGELEALLSHGSKPSAPRSPVSILELETTMPSGVAE
jgi:hypothetical protein